MDQFFTWHNGCRKEGVAEARRVLAEFRPSEFVIGKEQDNAINTMTQRAISADIPTLNRRKE